MLSPFIQQLWKSGRVRVGGELDVPPLEEEQAASEKELCLTLLQNWEAIVRVDYPGEPPRFLPQVALDAVPMFYLACQFLVNRHHPPELLDEKFQVKAWASKTAEEHYSRDLVLRHLPDLYHQAEVACPGDPLTKKLKAACEVVPLSTVGIPIKVSDEPEPLRESERLLESASSPKEPVTKIPSLPLKTLEPIWQHRSLRQIYIDRVVLSKDQSRLRDPRVKVAVEALGGGVPVSEFGLQEIR
ncbi:Hypothetical protein PBC10988_22140 [Planctomycetales bacterium 10988]|nr:Hypothetical protein PBC10988_22140 [Planctomycetales bacterium 10988]